MSPLVSTAVTVMAGLIFYVLRLKRRALYGLCEIIIAFGLMYIRYFPRGGPVLLAARRTGSRNPP
jgi:hypothetical protein